jgi:prepilin signal peptidase PulO-like enzyme (type II secretory pathway)
LQLIYASVVFLLGLVVGFVVNVVATRLAAHRPLFGPLHCTRAHHPVTWAQALPVAGYLLQGGRCSACGKRISFSYPLVELATAVLFVFDYLLEGFGLPFVFHASYMALLMLVLVIDWKHRDIYLAVIAAGCGIALLGSFVLPGVTPWGALIGAGVAGLFFLLAYIAAKLIFPKIEEPLGAGDILLALMMGLMLGWPNIVGALLIGPLIAGAVAILLLVSRRSKLGDFMPYGVALCVAAILFLVYPYPFAEALHLPALYYAVSNLFNP